MCSTKKIKIIRIYVLLHLKLLSRRVVRLTYLPTYLLTYSLTYSLTQWYRVLLEKLTALQQVKEFPAFHRTRRFITALTNVRHLSLSWASPIQSIYPHSTSWRSILILSTHLRLGLQTSNNRSYHILSLHATTITRNSQT